MKVEMESKPCDKNLQLTKLFSGYIRGSTVPMLIMHDHCGHEYEYEYDEMKLYISASSYSEAFDKLYMYAKTRYDEVLQVIVREAKYFNVLF